MLNKIIWLLAGILYIPVFIELYKSRWETIDYTHAYFILPVSLWLASRSLKNRGNSWVVEPSLNSRKNQAAVSGFFLLFLLGLLMFIFGWRQDYAMITTVSLIPLLFGVTGFLYGGNTAKALSFPILYLLLLVPPPLGVLDAITIPMRQWTTVLSVGALKALHYPVLRDGLTISVGGHEIYMGPACSGFRSLITMISLGIVYAYVHKGAAKTKRAMVLAIVPLALLGNFIRVMGVCMVTFHFGVSAGTKFHDNSGFVIFLILILGLIAIESLMGKTESASQAVNPTRSSQKTPVSVPGFFLVIGLLCLTILVSFALPKVKYKSPDILPQLQIPMATENWRGTDISGRINTNDLRYNFISRIFARVYQNRYGEQVTMLILDAGNFHNPKVCFTGSGYSPKDLPEAELKLAGRSFKATTVFFEKSSGSTVMLYWICIDKKQVNWTSQKLLQLWYSLFNKQKVGLMVRLEIPSLSDTTSSAIKTAQEFIADISKTIPKDQQEYLFGK